MTHRVGIVGGGNISDTHLRAALEIPGVEIAAVVGLVKERVEKMAADAGATPYFDYDEFLKHEPMDVVLLGTPSGLHAQQARAAAARGLHVLSEKPLDVKTSAIDALIEESERAGVKVGVFFQDRTSAHLQWVKRLIESGGLGDPILASARLRWYRPPEYFVGTGWRATWNLDGGGALMNQGVHTLDLLLWLFGDVSRVSGRYATLLHDIEVEDTVVATLEFANRALGTLEATTAAYPGYARRLELTGSNGTVIVEGDRVISADLRNPPAEPPPAFEGSKSASASSATVSDVSGHRRILEDFFRAIDTGGEPLCNAREGRRPVALAEAVYASSRAGQPVSLGGEASR
jgi:UDP-N-acetyl-2-amino-2-deoxyglucuronate dehydrogenase